IQLVYNNISSINFINIQLYVFRLFLHDDLSFKYIYFAFAKSQITPNKTVVPFAISSFVENSASLWLMPSLLGIKSMAVSATLAIYLASCPGPLYNSIEE